MKSYLLDTHVFLWAASKPEKLGRKISRALEKEGSLYHLSAISLIEIAQLYETKPREFSVKTPLATFVSQALTEMRVRVLAIEVEHAQRYYEIQPLKGHNDRSGGPALRPNHNRPSCPHRLHRAVRRPQLPALSYYPDFGLGKRSCYTSSP